MIWKMTDTKSAEPLFAAWEDTMILSCLQGVMGDIFSNRPEAPTSAMAALGDFRFFAGIPNRELVLYRPEEFIILVPENGGWAELIRSCFPGKHKQVCRYALKKEPHVFDPIKLRKIASSLPAGYTLAPIDEALYHRCGKERWSRSLTEQYRDYLTYRALGLGVAVLKDGTFLSGASSYSSFRGGIEIEIDTKEEFRRKGLASACGAQLILDCLQRGLYPSWDAQNKISLALAEKLGYRYSHTYDAYEVRGK